MFARGPSWLRLPTRCRRHREPSRRLAAPGTLPSRSLPEIGHLSRRPAVWLFLRIVADVFTCGIIRASQSRSVLAVKGSLRRVKRAPLTAPGRSEAHNLYEGKGIRGTSHLSTISASAPQSAFHRSTVLKCGRLLARSWPVPPTRNPEEPAFLTNGGVIPDALRAGDIRRS